MSLKRQYNECGGKVIEGYGGWKCHCCNPYRTSPRKMKPLARRLVRRTSKHKLNRDCRNED